MNYQKVYLAGGFFNEKQLKAVERAEKFLRSKGFEVFSPREHQFKDLPFGSKEWRATVFDNDVEHILWSDFVFAILDEQMDEGTLWEMGFAFAHGKPIILFNDSDRKLNLMVSDSITAYFDKWEDVEKYDFQAMKHVAYNGEVI
jgi:nucleoside 2-deoxyribosyltransferase